MFYEYPHGCVAICGYWYEGSLITCGYHSSETVIACNMCMLCLLVTCACILSVS